jgi:DNA-directed RNA polymerase subunit RPC12/RpoP
MPEQTYEIKSIGVDYKCDFCGDGTMEQTGIFLPTDPPQWQHRCTRCGHHMNMWQKYPNVRFERIEPR